MQSFDPHSPQAMFARIDEHLVAQDKAAEVYRESVTVKLDTIQTQVTKTNGRVTLLEQQQARQKGVVVAISLIIGALSWILPFVWPLLK